MADAMSNLHSDRPKAGTAVSAWRRILWEYGVAILAVAAGLAVRLLLAPVLSGDGAYLFFLPGVLVASALGGWRPGIFTTVLAVLLGMFVVKDTRALSIADVVTAVTFALVGIGVSWRGSLLYHFRRAATASAEATFAREAHLQSILDTIPDAMVVIDERGSMQSFSAAAERLFGFSAADVWERTSVC